MLPAIVQETTRDRLAETVLPVSRAHVSRVVLQDRYSVTANASRRVPIIYIAVPLAIVKTATREIHVRWVPPVNRAHASRDVLPVRFYVRGNV